MNLDRWKASFHKIIQKAVFGATFNDIQFTKSQIKYETNRPERCDKSVKNLNKFVLSFSCVQSKLRECRKAIYSVNMS